MASNLSSQPFVASADRLRPVRIWLYVIAALVLLMVAVGGITRLTDSGLSITEWKPISGTIPPLTDADWQAEFEAYKQIPQYQALNQDMTLAGFKSIFWWEWLHRFLGRFIGLAFALPFLVFLVQKRFSWNLAVPLAGLFVLGGLQGALGWWMVSSGLSVLTSVSQYRLAAHLGAACLLFIALIWVARRLGPVSQSSTPTRPLADLPQQGGGKEDALPPPARGRVGVGVEPAWQARVGVELAWPAVLLLILIFLQILAGAFVAGLDAGMGYNTWPLMDGALIPNGLAAIDPFWRNLFENALTVQFIHRSIAYAIVLYVAYLLWRQSRAGEGINGWLPRIALLILLQVGLGIATLFFSVPLPLALGHQSLAFMLAGAVTAWLADVTPRVISKV